MMLRRSRTSNRLWLFILGFLLLTAGAAGLWGSLGTDALGLPLPESGATLDDLSELPSWTAGVVLAVSTVVVLMGISWFLAAFPRPERVRRYLLQDDGATGLTELRAPVLASAVENHCRTVPGVIDATAHLGGSAQDIELRLHIEVDERSDILTALDSVKTIVLPSLTQAVEGELAAARIIVDPVRKTRSSKYATITTGQESAVETQKTPQLT